MKSSPANLLATLRDKGGLGGGGGEKDRDNNSSKAGGGGEGKGAAVAIAAVGGGGASERERGVGGEDSTLVNNGGGSSSSITERPSGGGGGAGAAGGGGRHERSATLRHHGLLAGYGEGNMPKKLEEYECLGLLFKRRGGMGRILGWKPRLFTLYRGLLCYYEADVPEDVKDWNKPRGSFDLNYKGATFIIHKAPSRPDQSPEYVFSIVGGYGGDSRVTWKLIADTEEDFDKWCKGLSAYLGEPIRPSDSPGSNGLEVDTSRWMPPHRRRSTDEPPTPRSSHVVPPAFDGLLKGDSDPSLDELRGASVVSMSLNGVETSLIMMGINLVLLAAHLSPSPFLRLLLIAGFNFCLFKALQNSLWTAEPGTYLLCLFKTAQTYLPFLAHGPEAPCDGDASPTNEGISSISKKMKKPETVLAKPATIPPIGVSVIRCPPNTPDDKMPEHSWTTGDSSNIRIRAQNYMKDHKKEASGPALYELVDFDFYRSENRVVHIASLRNDLPKIEADVPSHIPKLLVVSWQAPSEPPQFFSQDDGPGFSCILYFAIKEETVEALKDLDNASAGIRLFSDFFKQAPENTDMRDRFKAICVCKNMAELGLPKYIEACNGKPILLKHTANYYRGDGYLNIDINMHRFAYIARKGIQVLQDKFKLVAFESAFTIEGRTEDELPEVVLGVGKFNKMDVRKGLNITDEED